MKKPSSTKTMFLVELVMPSGMTSTSMCHIIANAIASEPGIHHPSEPIFNLDRNTIDVKNAGKVLKGIQSALAELRKEQKSRKAHLRVLPVEDSGA